MTTKIYKSKGKADLIKDRDQAMDDFRGHIAEDASTVKSAERIFKAAEHSLRQALKAQAKLKALSKPKVKKPKSKPPWPPCGGISSDESCGGPGCPGDVQEES